MSHWQPTFNSLNLCSLLSDFPEQTEEPCVSRSLTSLLLTMPTCEVCMDLLDSFVAKYCTAVKVIIITYNNCSILCCTVWSILKFQAFLLLSIIPYLIFIVFCLYFLSCYGSQFTINAFLLSRGRNGGGHFLSTMST